MLSKDPTNHQSRCLNRKVTELSHPRLNILNMLHCMMSLKNLLNTNKVQGYISKYVVNWGLIFRNYEIQHISKPSGKVICSLIIILTQSNWNSNYQTIFTMFHWNAFAFNNRNGCYIHWQFLFSISCLTIRFNKFRWKHNWHLKAQQLFVNCD